MTGYTDRGNPVLPENDPYSPAADGIPETSSRHSSPCSAARASSAAMWCRRSPGAAIASAPAMRRPDLAGYLQPLGRVGQIMPVQANLRYPHSVEAAVRDAHIVVNLVGILFERGRAAFDAVQAGGRSAVARAAKAAGRAARSCLRYRRRRAIALALCASQGRRRTRVPCRQQPCIVRPSIVFGPEDDFFNRFAALARMAPALPLVGGGHTRLQPVFVGDVAEAIAKAVDGDTKPGTIYESAVPTYELQGIDGIRPRHHRAPPPLGAGAVCADEVSGGVPAIFAEAADHARSGRTAQSDNVVSEPPSAMGARCRDSASFPE